jgi:hypothetical protein
LQFQYATVDLFCPHGRIDTEHRGHDWLSLAGSTIGQISTWIGTAAMTIAGFAALSVARTCRCATTRPAAAEAGAQNVMNIGCVVSNGMRGTTTPSKLESRGSGLHPAAQGASSLAFVASTPLQLYVRWCIFRRAGVFEMFFRRAGVFETANDY